MTTQMSYLRVKIKQSRHQLQDALDVGLATQALS